MIPEIRKTFNKEFSNILYAQLQNQIVDKAGSMPGFRISESPIFLPQSFETKLFDVTNSIISQIKELPHSTLEQAIPPHHKVPNDTERPHFLTIDFGICKDETGSIVPQLIELQAFPSLYGFQRLLEEAYIDTYPCLKHLPNVCSPTEYIEHLRSLIVGDENPENVVLLEIFPERQKTHIDFVITEKIIGIPTICLTQVIKEGKKLYYIKNDEKIEIKRIYNRVIFDELEQLGNIDIKFDFREEVDVKWVTHPNWFFKISKYILPLLSHAYIPKSYFLQDFPTSESLENYVLKPLFSFAGSGVDLHPTQATIAKISDKENYIMQRKVEYAPLFEDINGDFSKAEIRMLYIWKENSEEPIFLQNLVRMTKADMVNVNFNKKDAIWIGSSTAFFI